MLARAGGACRGPCGVLPAFVLRVLAFGHITHLAAPLSRQPLASFSHTATCGVQPCMAFAAQGVSSMWVVGTLRRIPPTTSHRSLRCKPNSIPRKAKHLSMESAPADAYGLRIGVSAQAGDDSAMLAAENLVKNLLGLSSGATTPVSTAELVDVSDGVAFGR